MAGKFYGIGVGPGDPELLTLKAYRTLQNVDVVCVPKSSADRESLALSVVNKIIKHQILTIELTFPMSRNKQILEEHWAIAGERVAQLVQQGNKVAFITIGDPMFYSTYGYIQAYLQKNYPWLPVETIPGVTAMSACAAALGEPLATGDEDLAVIPAVNNLKRLEETLDNFDNVVLMKINRHFDKILEILHKKNLINRAVLVSRCGYPDQLISRDITEFAGKNLDYMSILILRNLKGR